jgi:two-component system, OmpR family, alkaline phosphatase synthesis response regulator PhoP
MVEANKMTGKKVLVVDDEIHIVHVVAIKLRNNGYEILTANNGAEAYELACAENPDVIVTDFQMPVMSGIELVQKLREYEPTKNTPVIMLTARSFAISKEQQESMQISCCLSKPFSPRELLGNIEDILYRNEVAIQGS